MGTLQLRSNPKFVVNEFVLVSDREDVVADTTGTLKFLLELAL